MRISGSGRHIFGEERTMRSKKRESSVSLGKFTFELGLVIGSGSFDLAVQMFSRLFSIAFSRFCCTVLLITRLTVDYRNMVSKHRYDKKNVV